MTDLISYSSRLKALGYSGSSANYIIASNLSRGTLDELLASMEKQKEERTNELPVSATLLPIP